LPTNIENGGFKGWECRARRHYLTLRVGTMYLSLTFVKSLSLLTTVGILWTMCLEEHCFIKMRMHPPT